MDVRFANPSRSYDSVRSAVRFWGYDQSMELSFFVTEEALRKLQPPASTMRWEVLGAFDANRARIHQVAEKVYSRGRKGSYELQASDF